MSLKVTYINVWNQFDKNNLFISRIIKEIDANVEFDVGINDKKYDLVVSLMPNIRNGSVNVDVNKISFKKLVFTGERYPLLELNPGFDAYIGCDHQEDIPNNINYMRMPLYAIYNLDYMHTYNCSSYEELRSKFYTKKVIKKYCAVVSNPLCEFRNNLIKFLVEKNICDSGGTVHSNIQNIGSSQTEKLNFCKNYMYNLALENASKKGYITEKIFEAFMAGSVPYYWGAPDIELEFNPKSFFVFDSTSNSTSINCIQDMINKLDDIELYEETRKQDPITNFRAETYIKNCKEMIKNFIIKLLDTNK